MTDRVQMIAVSVSVLLLGVVLELVRRRKLTEEYSLLWIVSALLLLGLSARREMLQRAAGWLGVGYSPMVLVMLLFGMVFVALLCLSVIVSRQRRQIERLMEDAAILSAELRDLRGERVRTHEKPALAGEPVVGVSGARAESAGHVVARAAQNRFEPRG